MCACVQRQSLNALFATLEYRASANCPYTRTVRKMRTLGGERRKTYYYKISFLLSGRPVPPFRCRVSDPFASPLVQPSSLARPFAPALSPLDLSVAWLAVAANELSGGLSARPSSASRPPPAGFDTLSLRAGEGQAIGLRGLNSSIVKNYSCASLGQSRIQFAFLALYVLRAYIAPLTEGILLFNLNGKVFSTRRHFFPPSFPPLSPPASSSSSSSSSSLPSFCSPVRVDIWRC